MPDIEEQVRFKLKREWRWRQRSSVMRYAEEIAKTPLTEKELQQVKRQLKVVQLLKKLLKTSAVRDMHSWEEVEISGDLTLRKGKLFDYYWDSYWHNDKCVMPSDCDGNHRSGWLSEKRWTCVEPSLEIVQRFGVTTGKIKRALQKLRKQ